MKIYFIVIGGSVMYNLVLVLYNKGYQVIGSDDVIFEFLKLRLEKKGILFVEMGWFFEKIILDIEVVILGMYVKVDNLELLKVQELGLKIYFYLEFLYEQFKNKICVVIGGFYGKMIIILMILYVMYYYNIVVDYMVGV